MKQVFILLLNLVLLFSHTSRADNIISDLFATWDMAHDQSLNTKAKDVGYGCKNPPFVTANDCFNAGKGKLEGEGCKLDASASAKDCKYSSGKHLERLFDEETSRNGYWLCTHQSENCNQPWQDLEHPFRHDCVDSNLKELPSSSFKSQHEDKPDIRIADFCLIPKRMPPLPPNPNDKGATKESYLGY
jgi:hypothetical protein